MPALYQRFFIVFILLTVFTGRIVVQAMPSLKAAKEIFKSKATDNSEKAESTEKQDRLEEKDKPADLFICGLSPFQYNICNGMNNGPFSGQFNLIHRQPQIPEQPPK